MKYYFQPDLKVMRSDFQKRLDSFVVFFVPVLLDCTHGSEPFMCMKIAAEQNTTLCLGARVETPQLTGAGMNTKEETQTAMENK